MSKGIAKGLQCVNQEQGLVDGYKKIMANHGRRNMMRVVKVCRNLWGLMRWSSSAGTA